MRKCFIGLLIVLFLGVGAFHSEAQIKVTYDKKGNMVITNIYDETPPPKNTTPTLPEVYVPQSTNNTSIYSYEKAREKYPSRSANYETYIQSSSIKYNLDPELVKALIMVESQFTYKAVSNKGAMGLMQLMPATARGLGVKDSFDPEQNIEGGCHYLRDMLDTFDQNLKLACAAYNAGPHNVKRYKGVPPFKETQKYIKKINRYYQIDGSASWEDKSTPIFTTLDETGGIIMSNITGGNRGR